MKDVAVANKQLRYGVRFIVVCLLMNRRDTVRRLVRQLRTLVDDYARNFQVSASTFLNNADAYLNEQGGHCLLLEDLGRLCQSF